jgi:mannose-6-phosphate isomerase-like protein (cupin superfamily)
VINTGKKPLNLYTVYSPANHASGTVHKTKQDAVRAEAHAR